MGSREPRPPRRYAVVGTHHTGKTSVSHEVVSRLRRAGVEATFSPEASRASRYLAEGRRDYYSQTDIFAQTIVNELEALRESEVVICDRSIIDVVAYTAELPKPATAEEIWLDQGMRAFCSAYAETYRTYFQVTWTLPLSRQNDPLRVGDDLHQAAIAARIEAELATLSAPVVALSGLATAAEEITSYVANDLS